MAQPRPRQVRSREPDPMPGDIEELKRSTALLAHSDYTVPEAMREIVRQIPDLVAVESGGEQITFAEIEARANQLANALLDRGIDQLTPVLLLCDHGTAPPIAICGVLHAALIGVPVDVREPLDRLRRMVEQSGTEWIVADRPHLELARSLGDKVVVLDETASAGAEYPSVVVPRDHPGLILFTSGSTGTPKGVYGAHRGIVPRAMRTRSNPVTFEDRFALTSSWGFTAAEGQLFSGLMNGARICTYDLRTRGPRELAGWVHTSGITSMTLLPSVVRAMVEHTPPGTMDCLHRVSFGAEPLYWGDVQLARPMFGPETRLVHALGATEVGTIARYDIPPDAPLEDGPVPVGISNPSVEVRVVDEDDEPVPQGEPGRIVVVRRGHIALGYWRDPELTAAHFFVEPDGRRGFRTSDRGRVRPDGLLEHVGRLDTRVKVRGAMVATSEVEVALMSLDGVADAAVIAVPHDDGGTRLVAYVVPDGTTPLSSWRLRRDVAGLVPTTMVPASFVALDALPRTVRHKIDRAALPPPPAPASRPYREPVGRDAELAELFAEVLGVERVGLDDDFFDLGGDSLGAVELVAAIAERFAVDLPTSALLDAPTVAELSKRLSHRRPRDASPLVELRTDAGGNPFFCVTGGGAPAISLRALSEAMPDVNFAAIQARGLEERAFPDRTITAAARRNVGLVRARQPTGPYALGGYSFGALVAFETARQLVAEGDAVSLLVILDTTSPLERRPFARRARTQGQALLAGAPRHPLRRAAVVTGRAVRFGVRSLAAHAERRLAITTAGVIPRRGYRQYDLFVRLHAQMARSYRPAGTFDGPFLVVRGEHSDGLPRDWAVPETVAAAQEERRSRADLGWSELVTGPITVVDVPGDHLAILRRPAVEKVGALVSDALPR